MIANINTIFPVGIQKKFVSSVYTAGIASLIICLLVFIQWRNKRKRMYELATTAPLCAPLKPIIGHGLLFWGNTDKILETIEQVASFPAPSPSVVWLGPRLFYAVRKPEDVEIVFNSPAALDKVIVYEFEKNIFGEGILSATAHKWKKNRKLIQPTFSQKNLDGFVEGFRKNVDVMLTLIKPNEIFDVCSMLGRCALDIVCESAMGVDVNAQTTDSKYYKCLCKYTDVLAKRLFNPFLHPDFIYKFTKDYKTTEECAKYIVDFVESVIKRKKQEYVQNKAKRLSKPQSDNEPNKKMFLEMLLDLNDNGANFTDVELKDEVNTFVAAASDTSVTVTCFMLLMLGLYPDIQQKVYEETMEILGDNKKIEPSDLPLFKYTEMVIKETMRLFPVAPVVVRKANDDIKLTTCTIPKDAGIVVCAISTHRDPELYTDPLKFDPERFLPEEMKKRHPYAYYPFTAGLRSCIGQKYGYMFVKTVISLIIRKYRVETTYKSIDEIQLIESVVLKSKNGFPIKLIPRE